MCRTAYVSCAVRARQPGCAPSLHGRSALCLRPTGHTAQCHDACGGCGTALLQGRCGGHHLRKRCSGYNWFRGYNCCNGNVDATYNQCRAGRKPPLPALPRKSSRCPAKPAGTSSSRKAPTLLLSPRQRCGAVSLLPPHPRCAVSEVSSEQAPPLRDAQRAVHATAAAASVRVWL